MTETRPEEPQPKFSEISYINKKQINYLSDIEGQGPNHVKFLESMNFSEMNSKEHSHFDSIASELQKKILKQGYLDKPSKVSKKSKKGDSDVNYYNSSDGFINDDECCIQKKDKFSCFQDYEAVPLSSVEELYSHPLYVKKVEDLIVDLGKRKAPEQFTLTEEHDLTKFDEIKKNIKLRLLNKIKSQLQQGEGQKKIDGSDRTDQKQSCANLLPIKVIDVINVDEKSQEGQPSSPKQPT